MTVVRVALAVVFAVAAVAKLADRRVLLPLVELAVAALLVIPGTALIGAILAVVLLAGFTGWIARDPSADCECFGRLASTPGPIALLRNAVMLIAAGAVALNALFT
jgi:hypothetical protein